MKVVSACVFLLVFFAVGRVHAEDLTSTSFILRDPVLTVEGGYSSSPSFQYFSATGQLVSGESSSTTFISRAGFLYFSTGTSVVASPSPSPSAAPPAQPASGAGGSSVEAPPLGAIVEFSGRAYPLSRVHVMKDGQRVATTVAGPDARFEVTVSGLSTGEFAFVVSGEDSEGRRSSLSLFRVYVTTGLATRISGIFLAPTIGVDKTEVRRGDNLIIFGQSIPASAVTIEVNSERQEFFRTHADEGGAYLYNLDTSDFELGDHFARSKAASEGAITPFGQAVGFHIGTRTLFAQARIRDLGGDLNGDGRVNLIDFSIAAYWYKRPSPPSHVDLNSDGRINLADFSIMAFYWTG